MNSKKLLVGGIVAGISYFFLGWVIYGMLLKDFMLNNAGTATGVSKDPTQFVWWSLALGNLIMGFLIAYIIIKAKAMSAASGAKIGIAVGLLMSAGIDFIMYGTTNLATMRGIAADIAAMAVISGIAGGIAGLVLSMSDKKSVATV